MSNTYERFIAAVKDLNRLATTLSLLDWDRETYMPPKGAPARAEQIAALSEVIHSRLVSDEMGAMLDELQANPPGGVEEHVATTNTREVKRVRDRAVKLPAELVREIAEASSLATGVWATARKKNDFPAFAPHLEKLLVLNHRVADAIGYDGERYDALLDEYEPGATTAEVAEVFATLRDALVKLVEAIAGSPHQPDASIVRRRCPLDKQVALSRWVAALMGFDLDAGRIDTAPHPFCSGMSMHDVRLTTRYDLTYLPMSLFSTIHEAGHGLYEQGFAAKHVGTPMAEPVSLGIHESQSRLWENFVARSRGFSSHCFEKVQREFAPVFDDVEASAWYAAINHVRPSLIRVEDDEVTYGLHIILRFDLERALLNEELSVADVPAAWNEAMQTYLGVRPTDDRNGCLQDIHWSMGSFGYFPTYALGNLYAAQFFQAACAALGDLPGMLSRGELLPLRDWLRENIHRHGQRYRAGELVRHVTGKPLSSQPFLDYLNKKFGELYRF